MHQPFVILCDETRLGLKYLPPSGNKRHECIQLSFSFCCNFFKITFIKNPGFFHKTKNFCCFYKICNTAFKNIQLQDSTLHWWYYTTIFKPFLYLFAAATAASYFVSIQPPHRPHLHSHMQCSAVSHVSFHFLGTTHLNKKCSRNYTLKLSHF